MKNGLKLILITLPIILIGLAFVAFIVVNRPAPERHLLTERATAVRVIVAQELPVAPLVTGYGIVQPARTYDAIAQVAGTAEYVNPALQKGAVLAVGSTLLRLSQADFNLAIAQVKGSIRSAEAKLAEFSISEKNLSAALSIENEALDLKTADLERAEALFSKGSMSQAALDAARARHLTQRQKVLSVSSSLALLPTQRAVQAEQIALSKVNLETALLNLARTELTLPFDARVASVSTEVGQFVRAGQIVSALDGIDAAEVEAQVLIADLRTLLQSAFAESQVLTFNPYAMTKLMQKLGLRANVQLRLGQETLKWPATVDRISDTIDQKSGTIGVIIRVDSAYSGTQIGKRPPLTKGMFVEATMSGPPVKGIIVPRSALRDGKLMLADEDDRLQLVAVAIRFMKDEFAVISKGLAPGARVVVSAPTPVVVGMLLDVSEDIVLAEKIVAIGVVE